MDTLHLLIAVTLALITVAQGVSSCTNGDFELIQDPADTRIVGYVQYCFRGEWGRVCREGGHTTLWDDSEAAVACRQLGYTSTGYAYVSHDNRTWTGGFVTLNCNNGLENSLEDCDPYRVITDREDSCKSGNQARLLCEPADCSDGTIRLVGGSTDREGRVEVCVGGFWGTVQTNQSLEVAQTICTSQSQSLSFYSTSSCYVSQFGYSLSKPVYSCSLNTNGGLECLNSTTPDDHTRDLGVSCDSIQNVLMCYDHQSGQFRLVDGRSHNEGRLEVCVGGQWRGVSTTSLSNTTAREICSRLGFSGYEPTVMSSKLTRGNVYCCNTELHCTQCNNCNQTMSVGLLKCRTYQETTTVLSRQAFTTMSPTTNNPQTVDATTMISNFCQSCDGTVNTVLGATVGVLLILLLVTVVALVNTCVALRMKNKQSKQGESYPSDNRQDNPDGKGTEVNPAYDAVKYTQGEETYETVH